MNQKQKGSLVRKWIEDNQGKHCCQCGCGGHILIQVHHHARGIPRFIDGHGSRVKNPMCGRKGKANPNYKKGKYVGKNGYVYVLMPGRRSFNYIQEHRLVMERHLGRPLRPDEVVHHKNRDKTDNRLENLELTTNPEHSRHHALAGEIGFRLLRSRGLAWHRKKGKGNG